MPLPALPRPREAWLPWLLAAAAFTLLFVPSWLRWRGYAVQSFDFGIYAHAFWNAAAGNGFVSSIEFGDHLGSHAAPMLYALLPFYLLAPSPLTLLALSAGLLAAAAFPLWRLARRVHGPGVSALLVALLVLQPATSSLAFDLHEAQVALPLLLWAIVFAVEGRLGPFAVAALAALGCKENVSLVVAALGLWLAARPGRSRWVGVATVAASLAWLAVAVGWYIPLFGGDHAGATMSRFAHLGEGWGGLLLAPLLNPAAFWGTLVSAPSALYLGRLLVTWGFLPLLAPRAMLAATPILLQNLLSSHEPMRSLAFHYEALLLPVLAWGAVEGLARWRGPGRRWGVAGLLLVAAGAQVSLGKGLLHAVEGDPHAAEYAEVLARVPPGEPVAAPPLLQPRLADRVVAAHFGPQNPVLRERATRPVPPGYTWMIVPTAPTRAGSPQPGYEVADFPGHEVVFTTPHLALLKRR